MVPPHPPVTSFHLYRGFVLRLVRARTVSCTVDSRDKREAWKDAGGNRSLLIDACIRVVVYSA